MSSDTLKPAIKSHIQLLLINIHLGLYWVKSRKLGLTIIYLSLATQLKSKLEKNYYQLANVLVQEKLWNEAVNCYYELLELNPGYFDQIYNSLGNCLIKLQLWKDAESLYTKALSLVGATSFLGYNYLQLALVKQGRPDEAISVTKESIRLRPSNPGAYWNLANLYLEKELWEDAIEAYNKVIQLNPNYLRSRVDRALKDSLVKRFADEIWNFLNQPTVTLPSSSQWSLEIDEEQQLGLYDYFTKNSKYKVLDLEFLETLGTSFYLEKLAVKACNQFRENLKKGVLHQSKNTKTLYEFNRKALKRKSLEFICPWSGKVVESNLSFIVDSVIFYRFYDPVTYYLMVGGYGGHKLGVYFPAAELIIRFNKQSSPAVQWCNRLKSFLVVKWNIVKDYLLRDNDKKLVAVIGILEHFGHTVLNEYASYQHMFECGDLSKFEKIIIGNKEYIQFSSFFPEIENTRTIKCKNDFEIFKFIVENNCFAIRPTNPSYLLPRNLAERIYNASLQDSSKSTLKQIECAKKCFPLLWFEVRTNDRMWLNQAEGIAEVVNRLYLSYPNIGVIFAGWSCTDHNTLNEFLIEQDKAVTKKSRFLIHKKILSFEVVAYKIHEKIAWGGAADLHIVGHGSGYIFSSIANKPAIIHTNTGWYPTEVMKKSIKGCHQNHPLISVVPIEHINDDNDNRHFHVRNYYCNWQEIYQEIVKLLNALNLRR